MKNGEKNLLELSQYVVQKHALARINTINNNDEKIEALQAALLNSLLISHHTLREHIIGKENEGHHLLFAAAKCEMFAAKIRLLKVSFSLESLFKVLAIRQEIFKELKDNGAL